MTAQGLPERPGAATIPGLSGADVARGHRGCCQGPRRRGASNRRAPCARCGSRGATAAATCDRRQAGRGVSGCSIQRQPACTGGCTSGLAQAQTQPQTGVPLLLTLLAARTCSVPHPSPDRTCELMGMGHLVKLVPTHAAVPQARPMSAAETVDPTPPPKLRLKLSRSGGSRAFTVSAAPATAGCGAGSRRPGGQENIPGQTSRHSLRGSSAVASVIAACGSQARPSRWPFRWCSRWRRRAGGA